MMMAGAMELDALLGEYLSAKPGERFTSALRALAACLKARIDAGDSQEAASVLRRSILPTLDYSSAQTLARLVRLAAKAESAGGALPRVAVLSSFTTDQLTPLIETFLFALGVRVEVYSAEYGVFRQEILDPESALYSFRPKIVFLATNRRDLGHAPSLADGLERVGELVDAEFGDWRMLWDTLHDRLGCLIVQNNFDRPASRSLDNLEIRHPSSPGNFIEQMNRRFAEQAPPFVTVHDVDHLAACAGRWAWGDERFYHSAKLPCAPEYLVDYAHSVASLVGATLGKGKKCLVLDLDNTLWGGVIGDDGLGGIRLGQGEAESEAFQAFQRYAKSLQERGVILAVCSKNEDNIAREPFEKHTEMVLRLDDISCFIANWTDKATNLRTIASRLNIGLDSLVFVDDNPAERAIVRQLAPEVAVPEMPEDPSGYIEALERHRYFQMLSLGAEDFQRTEYYRGNAAREACQADAGSVAEFLQSLNMTATIAPVNESTLERTAQLINRSNQFNLTTRRRSAAEVRALAEDDSWITRTVTLSDRFGDNGLISVLLARLSDGALVIDTWLMSCRVLKRGVEDLLLNHLVEVAASRGARAILGEYIPTAKNVLVRDHYAGLGFHPVESGDDGRTTWELPVSDDWSPRVVYIRETSVGVAQE